MLLFLTKIVKCIGRILANKLNPPLLKSIIYLINSKISLINLSNISTSSKHHISTAFLALTLFHAIPFKSTKDKKKHYPLVQQTLPFSATTDTFMGPKFIVSLNN